MLLYFEFILRKTLEKTLYYLRVVLVQYKLLDNVVLIEEVLVLSLTFLYVNLYLCIINEGLEFIKLDKVII